MFISMVYMHIYVHIDICTYISDIYTHVHACVDITMLVNLCCLFVYAYLYLCVGRICLHIRERERERALYIDKCRSVRYHVAPVRV